MAISLAISPQYMTLTDTRYHTTSRATLSSVLGCSHTAKVVYIEGNETTVLVYCGFPPIYSDFTLPVASKLKSLGVTIDSNLRVTYKQRVTYKLAVLTHKVRTTATPTYLCELVQTHAPPRALRCSDAPMLVVPRIHTELARRAFSVAAASTWNSLPADIRLCENILTFKRHLKTHLFKLT